MLYDFNSSSFHFDTYLFDLSNNQLNQEELAFFNSVKSGLWLAKDPDGSLGIGLKLFNNVSEIKAQISKLKL
jgi:hypothetical protein